MQRLSLLMLVLALSACGAKPTDTSPRAEDDPAGAASSIEPAPTPQPTEPNAPAVPAEVLARIGEASLTVGTPIDALPSVWPDVVVEPAPDKGAHALRREGKLLAWYFHDDELCFMGAGIVDPQGIEVGQRLTTIPGANEMGCAVERGDELLHLGELCPGDIEGKTMLVCELGSPFRRLFFAVDAEHAKRAGDELRGADLEAFGDPTLVAIHLMAGQPDPEPAEPTSEPDAAPEKLGPVFARTTGDPPHELRAGTPATIDAIGAALPGLTVEKRRHYGLHVYRGETKAATIMADTGQGLYTITLEGPGLADPQGIEVGAKASALRTLKGLSCELSGDESWETYVSCRVEGEAVSHYIFVKNHDYEHKGEMSLAEAEKWLGDTPLTAIEVYLPEPQE